MMYDPQNLMTFPMSYYHQNNFCSMLMSTSLICQLIECPFSSHVFYPSNKKKKNYYKIKLITSKNFNFITFLLVNFEKRLFTLTFLFEYFLALPLEVVAFSTAAYIIKIVKHLSLNLCSIAQTNKTC